VEVIPIAVLVIPIFVVGIYPAIITDALNAGVSPIVESLQQFAQGSLP